MSLSRQSLWGQLINTSKESLNSVLIKRLHLDCGSKIQWRGRSFTAQVASNTPQEGSSRKKVSRHERRSMVENYVEKYREKKSGKFPTITETKKYVGGSHYTIREIIQELEYNSKMSSSVETKDKNAVSTNVIEKVERLIAPGHEMSGLGVQVNVQLNNGALLRKELEEERTFTEGEEVLSNQSLSEAPVSNTSPLVATNVIQEDGQLTASRDELSSQEVQARIKHAELLRKPYFELKAPLALGVPTSDSDLDKLDSIFSGVESKLELQTSISHEEVLDEDGQLPVVCESDHVPSDTPQRGTSRKRVSEGERRSMVESYVKEYKEKNAGKFPTITETKKNVGGSHYLIRDILQVLKYNSEQTPINAKEDKMVEIVIIKEDEKVTIAEDKLCSQEVEDNVQLNNMDLLIIESKEENSFTGAKEVLTTQLVLDATITTADTPLDTSSTRVESEIELQSPISPEKTSNEEPHLPLTEKSEEVNSFTEAKEFLTTQDVIDLRVTTTLDTNSTRVESEIKLQSPILSEKTLNEEPHLPLTEKSDDVERQSNELNRRLISDPETNAKQGPTSEDEVKFDELQHKSEQKQLTDSEQSRRELHVVPKKDEKRKETSVWQNLKSLASGLFDIWRRK